MGKLNSIPPRHDVMGLRIHREELCYEAVWRARALRARVEAARSHTATRERRVHVSELVGGARVGRKDVQWVRALKQARLPVNMGGMGLTSAEDIRGAAWVGTWALVTRPIRELHRPFADLDVSTAPGECFDELREAHTQLVSNHDLTDKCQRSWRTQVVCEPGGGEPGHCDQRGEGGAEVPLLSARADAGCGAASPRPVLVRQRVPAPSAAAVHLWRAPL